MIPNLCVLYVERIFLLYPALYCFKKPLPFTAYHQAPSDMWQEEGTARKDSSSRARAGLRKELSLLTLLALLGGVFVLAHLWRSRAHAKRMQSACKTSGAHARAHARAHVGLVGACRAHAKRMQG